MFHVYAVVESAGEKHRHFIAEHAHEMMAKHAANVATCSWADYAYVKDTTGGTIFFIRRPDYESAPHRPAGQVHQLRP